MEGGSTGSRSSLPHRGADEAFRDEYQMSQSELEETSNDEGRQGGFGSWLSFLTRDGTAASGALATTAAAPFLTDAAHVVEMQVLRSGSVPS